MKFPETLLRERSGDVSLFEGPPAYDWMKKMVLYEVYVRDFSEEGTFAGTIKNLDRIKELGATDVWLMPIHPIGKVGRKGSLGCPYSVADYMEVNPEYGTKYDFKTLVEEVHNRGMHIFIDAVLNHSAHDNVNVKSNPDWFYKDDKGRFTRREIEWQDVIDNNYSRQDFREYLKNVLLYWVNEFGIDGYRCDVAHMVPQDFWEDVTGELRKVKPDLYMLAESHGPGSEQLCKYAFQSDYKHEEYLLMKDIISGRAKATELLTYWTERRKVYPANYLPLNYVENHDQQPAAKLFTNCLLYTSPSPRDS